MSEGIHIRLETLTSGPQRAEGASSLSDAEAFRSSELPAQAEAPGFERGTFFLETFGCQMNEHDSEKVAGVLLARGYRQVETAEAASLILYNTCSIREKAAQKVFSRLGVYRDAPGRANGRRPQIAVLGCVAQQEGEAIFSRAPWVSLVCGSASYRNLPQMLARLEAGEERVTGLDNDTDQTFETEMTRRDNPWRAYITIIEGCNKACAYCVVPFTRGPERSRDSARVLAELRSLADLGYSEVQFLGQTVNSYADPSPRKMRFSELLAEAAQVPGIRRVRFTTSHPRDFTPDIVEAIDSHPALCNHVHLPVQSGSSRVLRAMQRTYTREEYLEKIALIRAARRPIAVTTDIIVGFPGETEGEFEETLALLEQVKYEGVFAFKYSPRPHTPAASMPDANPEEDKSRRLAVLLERQRAIQVEALGKLRSRIFEVHVDGRSKKDNQWYGHTSCNRVVNFSSSAGDILGQYVPVRVTRCTPNSLLGEHAAGS
jgi:tRNA-2-methylthio-N6-dimethylallyladenosine synthase